MQTERNRLTAVFGKSKLPGDEIKATIRIDEQLWADFDDYAKAHDTDRSALIRKFIKDLVNG
jgi:hypothetical protein